MDDEALNNLLYYEFDEFDAMPPPQKSKAPEPIPAPVPEPVAEKKAEPAAPVAPKPKKKAGASALEEAMKLIQAQSAMLAKINKQAESEGLPAMDDLNAARPKARMSRKDFGCAEVQDDLQEERAAEAEAQTHKAPVAPAATTALRKSEVSTPAAPAPAPTPLAPAAPRKSEKAPSPPAPAAPPAPLVAPSEPLTGDALEAALMFDMMDFDMDCGPPPAPVPQAPTPAPVPAPAPVVQTPAPTAVPEAVLKLKTAPAVPTAAPEAVVKTKTAPAVPAPAAAPAAAQEPHAVAPSQAVAVEEGEGSPQGSPQNSPRGERTPRRRAANARAQLQRSATQRAMAARKADMEEEDAALLRTSVAAPAVDAAAEAAPSGKRSTKIGPTESTDSAASGMVAEVSRKSTVSSASVAKLSTASVADRKSRSSVSAKVLGWEVGNIDRVSIAEAEAAVEESHEAEAAMEESHEVSAPSARLLSEKSPKGLNKSVSFGDQDLDRSEDAGLLRPSKAARPRVRTSVEMTEEVPQEFKEPANGREALTLVAQPNGPWNWVFVGPDPDALPLVGGGPGSVSEMRACLASQRKHAVIFGLCRVLVGTGNMRRHRHVFVFASHEDAGFGALSTGRAMLCRGAMEKVIHQIANYVATVEVKHADDLTLKAMLDMVEHKVIVDHGKAENAQAFLETSTALQARVRARSGNSIRPSVVEAPGADEEFQDCEEEAPAAEEGLLEERRPSALGTPRSTPWIKSPRPPGFVKKKKPTAWVTGAHGCGIRSQPSFDDADKNGKVLMPGETFLVSEERPSPDGSGALLLCLADGRGWAFDHKPNSKFGMVCRRAEEAAPPAVSKEVLAAALDTDVDSVLREIRKSMAAAEVEGDDGSNLDVTMTEDEQAAFALQDSMLRQEVKTMIMTFAEAPIAEPEVPEAVVGIMLKQASDFFGRWSLRIFEISKGKVRYWPDLTSKRQNFRPKYEYNLLNATVVEGSASDASFVLSLKKDGDKLHKRPPYKLSADISRYAKADERRFALGRNVWATALNAHITFAHEDLVYKTAQKVALQQRKSNAPTYRKSFAEQCS